VEKYKSASEIRVLDTLMDMRRYRMGLVQTFDQLRFSYLAIIEGIRRIVHIPSRDSGYENSVEASAAHCVFVAILNIKFVVWQFGEKN